MRLEAYKSILYSDTLVPDVFISEYLPSMEGDFAKVYLHCLFLSKYGKRINAEEIAKKLEIDPVRVKECFEYLERAEIAERKDSTIILADLKEKQIKKMFRLRETSDPEQAVKAGELHRKRSQIITSINNKFFSGLMPPSLYTDIDAWFDRYNFDEEVMFMLFAYCSKNNALSRNYIQKVAEAWQSHNVKTVFELEAYFAEYQKFKDIRGKIVKKLKLSRNLTEYEENILEKWLAKYKYDFAMIETAMKKTVAKTNPSFRYIDRILSEWHEKGIRTTEEAEAEIKAFESSFTEKGKDLAAGGSHENVQGLNTGTGSFPGKVTVKGTGRGIPQKTNYSARKYEDEYLESLYFNVGAGKTGKKENSGIQAKPDDKKDNSETHTNNQDLQENLSE
ncbi:MAG: DnaD domain protein [Eubacteriales bacterium]|nr:DnaD domain protein [Eubacteriales bacterium]